MLQAPAEHWRGTFGDLGMQALPITGVYLMAYMGRVLYVGRASDVEARLEEHLAPGSGFLDIDWWLQSVGMQDPRNVRLDILGAPYDGDGLAWTRAVEAACIRRLHPLFNGGAPCPARAILSATDVAGWPGSSGCASR